MKKFVTSLLAMVMLLSLCTGCGGQKDSSSTGDTASAGTPSAETVVLRLANSHNAEHITSQACQMFADLVNEKTDGRITIECHFAGELGDERSTIEQCQFGGLDFTRVSSGASAEFAPLMNALQMPYEYTSVDHLFEVLDGEIGQEVFETFKDNKPGGYHLSASRFQKLLQLQEGDPHPRRSGRHEDPCVRVRPDADPDGLPGCCRRGSAL